MVQRLSTLVLFVIVTVLVAGGASAQRLSYSSGQNVSPGYEGWEEDDDGSRWFVFGYMNRNWEEEPFIPIGPDNDIQPGGPDLGQPTRFQPRRNRFVFRVPVPDDFEVDDEMVWTLTVNGVTERAYATLRPDYFVDDIVRASEHGALGAGTSNPAIRANTAPILEVLTEPMKTVRVGEPLTLVASATDDGVPESERRRRRFRRSRDGASSDRRWLPATRSTVGTVTGLRVSWFVYRGDGDVTIEPPQVKAWEDTRTGGYSPWAPGFVMPEAPDDDRWVTQMTFEKPGTYVVRCRASDGALDVDGDVTVTVTP